MGFLWWLAAATAAVAASLETHVPPVPSCINVSHPQPPDQLCASFCNGQCAFLGRNDTGRPEGLDLYRVTPANATSPANKNFGDALGDLEFYFYIRSGEGGKFLKGDNIVGRFSVKVDGLWGPYLKCNPRGDVTNTSEPYDNFLCDYACLDPPCPPLVHNSSEACSCPGTHREHETVGREHNPLGGVPVPMSLRPTIPPLPSGYLNCTETVVKYECDYAASVDECVACIGRHNVTLRACRDDASVQGAACLVDKTNYTECIHAVETLTSCTRPTDVASYRECFACAYRALGTSTEWRDSHCPFLAIEDFCLSGMSEWWPYKPLLLEGDWYSLPAEGECRAEPEAAIAAGKQEKGCSWTASLVKFVNETCITDRVDKAVMSRNSACFDGCPDTDAVCWQECYFTGLAGNATAGLEPMTADTLQQLWLSSFQAESDGGCPTLIPPHQTGE